MTKIITITDQIEDEQISQIKQYVETYPSDIVNSITINDIPMIHLAVAKGNLETVKMLIARKVNVNFSAINNNGYTPLHIAARQGFAEICEELLKSGAKASATCDDGNTSLHLASIEKRLEIVRVLLKNRETANRRIDINAQNKMGETPLHMVSYIGDVEIAKELITAGADKDIQDHRNHAPLVMAQTFHYTDLVELLGDKTDLSWENAPHCKVGPVILKAAKKEHLLFGELPVIPEIYYVLDSLSAELLKVIINNRVGVQISTQLVDKGIIYISAKAIETAFQWQKFPNQSPSISINPDEFLAGIIDIEAPDEVINEINRYNEYYGRIILKAFEKWAWFKLD